ncbi:MAG: hypothetical protein QXV21_02825 [Candidatus Bathyarchaeia archaeon]
MKKIKIAFIVLTATTILWAALVYLAYAKPIGSEFPDWIVWGFSPGDYMIGISPARPAGNGSWIVEVFYRGELIWNYTVTGEVKCELSGPIPQFLEECMQWPGFDRRLNKDITLEEFYAFLPELDVCHASEIALVWGGICKIRDAYYVIGKMHSIRLESVLVINPHMEYVRRHIVEIRPPVIGSGASLGACWIGLGTVAVRQKIKETSP